MRITIGSPANLTNIFLFFGLIWAAWYSRSTSLNTPARWYLGLGGALGAFTPIPSIALHASANWQPFYSDTYILMSIAHSGVPAAALLWIFAAICCAGHVSLWRIGVIAHAIAISVTLQWYLIITSILGRQGMPLRYPDYPKVFAPLQAQAHTATVCLAMLVCAGLIACSWSILRRR